MRIDEVIPTVKPIAIKTPEQQRVANLKQNVDRAKSALGTERERQQRSRAHQSLRRAQARMRAVVARESFRPRPASPATPPPNFDPPPDLINLESWF